MSAQISLSGKIINTTRQPLPQANVELKNADTTFTSISDNKGNFVFKNLTENTKWTLSVTYTGKIFFKKQITLQSTNVEQDIVLDETAIELEPLEVRAIRASDLSPFTKTEITQAEIARNNTGKDLPFILEQTPNVIVNSDAGNGIGYTGISIRGSDGTRTNVTINGIPYNDAESSMSYFVDIPDLVSSVGSIQIQRGVGSSTNGSGAFGATINLSTNEVHTKPYVEINNSYGSFNTWKNTVMAGSGLIDGKFTADVRLSNISSNGYIDRATSSLQSLLLSTAYLGKKTTVRFNFITGKEKTYQAWDGVPEDSLKTNRRYNELGYINDSTFYNNQTDNYRQTHYQLFVTYEFNKNWAFNLTSFLTHGEGYYEEYKLQQDYATYGIPYPVPFSNDTVFSTDLIRRQWLNNNFYGETFSFQYKNQNNELTLGGVWTNYDGQHYANIIWAQNGGIPANYEYYNLPAYKYDKSIYAKWLHTFDKYWNFYADVQYRNDWYHIFGFEDNPDLIVKRTFNFVNPKAGISYKRNGWNAYFSYALANKEPNRDDYEANEIEQPKPERLHDFELGVHKKNAKFSFGANAYYMLYKDQLVLTGKLNDVGEATRMNVPNSYRAGIELQGAYIFAKWLNAAANLSFSRNKIKLFTAYYNAYDADWNELPQAAQQYSNTNIAYSPNVVGAATIHILPLKNWEISFIGKYVSRQYMDNTQTLSRSVAGYYRQDATISYTLKNKFFKELNIMATVYNLFNRMYCSTGFTYPEYDNGIMNNYNYFFPMAGINYMVGVNIKL